MMGRKMASQKAATGTARKAVLRRSRLCAWIVSVLVHVLILAGLWFVHFPQDQGRGGDRLVALATVSHVRKVTQSSPTLPKPRVRLPSQPAKLGAASLRQSRAKRGTGAGQQDISSSIPGDLDRFGKQSYLPDVPADAPGLADSVGFFGSYSQHRKVCYVVDCSGSMRGSFSRVQDRLKQSISDLQPDQYFHIIFFGDGMLTEFAGGRLHRAAERNKAAACDFIDSVRPAGATNAMAALERALKIRDVDGNAPSVIYFLTDGFDLDGKGSSLFGRRVAEMAARFASATQINTIGFWPQDDDRTVLEAIAQKTGGKCVLIAGDVAAPDL